MDNWKTAIAAIAVFASAAACHASRLAPVSLVWESDEDEQQSEAINLGELEKGETLSFTLEDDFPEEINGMEVLTSFLPESVELEWTGKKLKPPKAGKVAYSKKEEDFVDSRDSFNPSGLTVKSNKKTGKVSGTFKVYVAKSERKLKTFTAKFSGKVGQSMKVLVKGKKATTAVIE